MDLCRNESMIRFASGARLLAFIVPVWLPHLVWGDCLGNMRDTTEAEKQAYDHIRQSVPGLFRPPAGYDLDRIGISVSRDRRCADGAHDPLYLPLHLRFTLQGKAREEAERELAELQTQQLQVMQKYLPQTLALQAEQQKHLQSFPHSDEDQQALDRIQKEIDALVSLQRKELAPLERKAVQIRARGEIRVDVEFNTSLERCQGKAVSIPGASAACLDQNEDGSASLKVLMGDWRRGDGDDWEPRRDPEAPAHRLQHLAVLVIAAQGESMDWMRSRTDWQGLAALMGGSP